MGKMGLFPILLMILCFREIHGRPQQTKPGCWYEGKRYQDGQMVNTTEPCLRCRCNDGSLRCRLRVCPRLPSPMPQGCTTRIPRDNACCAELVCGLSHERNVTARRESAEDARSHEDGCLHEGVRYGPGSAMMSSRRCEYCYCIAGSRKCLRPRCLLPLAGCTPLYSPYSCCPVAYNCQNSTRHSDPVLGSSSSISSNGCRVGNRSYVEGEMVRDIGLKGTCDNCFCAMGGVRCVPLACAPPLQGCTPIVREGHCCPSTYNCSGSIEVKATQNYASYAFISKDYAKFRKETNFLSMDLNEDDEYQSLGNSTVEGRSHKNNQPETNKISKISTNSTTKKPYGQKSSTLLPEIETTMRMEKLTNLVENTTLKVTTILSHETETMNNEIPTETMENEKISTLQQETTFPVAWTTNEITEIPTTFETMTNFDLSTTLGSDELSNSTEINLSTENSAETSLNPEISTERFDEETTMDSTTINEEKKMAVGMIPEVRNKMKNVDNEKSTDKIVDNTTKYWKIINVAKDNQGHLGDHQGVMQTFGIGEASVLPIKGPVTGSPTTILMPENMLVINVTLKTNVSVGHVQGVTMNPVRSIPPDIEAILNITNRKKGEEYDYDYSQPTLPPSLPNVRIIPFVAADALVKTGEDVSSQVTNYPLGSVGLAPQELRPTMAPGTSENFYDIVTQKNRFSPPIETEGGFVPREPLYYDPPYRSTDHNLEIRNGVTLVPADITNSHRKNDELAGICVFENRNYRHGDILPSSGHCIICICYYGEVACSDEKCPPLKIGCTRLENDKICCGKIICVDAEESPTVVLDRADAIAPSPREPLPSIDGMASPDPFRDVIKTKPAPDLPSLIGDMNSYYVEHRITKPTAPTTPMTSTNLESSVQGTFDLRPEQKFSSESINAGDDSLTDEESKIIWKSKETPKYQGNRTSSTGILMMNDRLELTTNRGPSTNDTLSFDESTKVPLSGNPEQDLINRDDEESSIFSFGSVFDLLFAENPETQMINETAIVPADVPHKISPSSADIPDKILSKVPVELSSEDPPEVSTESPQKSLPVGSQDPSKMTIFAESAPLDYPIRMKEGGGNIVSDDSWKYSTIIDAKLLKTTTGRSVTRIKVDQTQKTMTIVPPTGSISKGNSQGITTVSLDSEIVTSVSGLLKLAGCNIYGRMYRVGRIITELSSPCLECRCTEVGVQCKQLEC